MKWRFLIIFYLTLFSKKVISQPFFDTYTTKLTVSDRVSLKDPINENIITNLKLFLDTKNKFYGNNNYWVPDDFKKFIYPYYQLINIEKDSQGHKVYFPFVLDIEKIDDSQRIITLQYSKKLPPNDQDNTKIVYQMIAEEKDGSWLFKHFLHYAIRDWKTIQGNTITYYLPPNKEANLEEIAQQEKDVEMLINFFEIGPIHLTYYSCETPQQLYYIRGIKYLPGLEEKTYAGLADFGGMIYSGNNKEIYTHEIVHTYLKRKYKKVPHLLNEGMATFVAGSGLYNYLWHREKVKHYIEENQIDFTHYTDVYDNILIDKETPIPYMVGALLIEHILRNYDKQTLFQVFSSSRDLWVALANVGITPSNLHEILLNELKSEAFTFEDYLLQHTNP